MGEVIISVRDKAQSWDDIHELLIQSHKKNIDDGIIMKTTTESSDDLKKRVGDGFLYVATIDEKLVGCLMITIKQTTSWYVPKGIVGHLGLGAVHPEYQGKKIYSKLNEKIEEHAKTHNCDIINLDTAENNKHMLALSKKNGFRFVDFMATKSNHYSIIMAKCLGKEFPFPQWYCSFRYNIKKMYVKLRYKPGAIKRFKI